MQDLKDIRRSYSKNQLNEDDLTQDPLELFDRWYKVSVKNEADPTAFVLATSTDTVPNVRIVLLKAYDEHGFVFYTNYKSEKGMEIEQNPNVAMNFYWPEVERQVRILGVAEKVPSSESDEYFRSRPFMSRIAAIASSQSSVLTSMGELNERVETLAREYEGQDPPRPEHWGGYVIKPYLYEFWQGKPNRLHDRFRYTLEAGTWKAVRLFP